MPVIALDCPSISLAQLQSVTRQAHGDRVDIDVLYPSHDIAVELSNGSSADGSPDLYSMLCSNMLHNTGLGDWFFRQVAFPHLPDNSAAYLRRYYPGNAPETRRLKETLIEQRRTLEGMFDRIIDRYQLDKADVVGFSSMFQQATATLGLARKIRERNPETTIVVGGANCETPMGETLASQFPVLDYVFSGPALISFPKFVGHYLEGDRERCAEIKGVFTSTTCDRPLCDRIGEELDINVDVPIDYEPYFRSLERNFPNGIGKSPAIFFETSRGCWWGEKAHCTFCGLNGLTMNFRAMEPARAVSLIQGLVDRYYTKSNFFFAVDCIIPKNFPQDVLPKLDPPKDVTFFFEVKADLKEDVVRLFSQKGVTQIQPGIESLATSTLRLMRKGSSVFTNLRLLKNSVRYEVKPQWNLLVGFPGETDDVYKMYVSELHKLHHLYPPDGAFPVRFDRFSPYYTMAEEYKLDLRPYDYYSMIYDLDQDAISKMAYFFLDHNFDAPYAVMMIQWLGRIREKTTAWLSRWTRGQFSDRPRLDWVPRGEAGFVEDTRTGQRIEHEISPARLSILKFLETPAPLDKLEAFVASQGLDPGEELRFLDDNELIWKEDSRVMSLVLFPPVPE
jgi:ribosomal peptide maturation radical SAM protein 1